jgi:hypothetical protein
MSKCLNQTTINQRIYFYGMAGRSQMLSERPPVTAPMKGHPQGGALNERDS